MDPQEYDDQTKELNVVISLHDVFRGTDDVLRGSDDIFRGSDGIFRGSDNIFRGSDGIFRGSDDIFGENDDVSRRNDDVYRGSNNVYRENNHVDSEPDEDVGSQDVSMDNNTVDGEQDGSTVGQGGVGGGGTGSRGLAATGSRGRDRRPKVRKPRFRFHRAQFQATTASLSPVNMDFSVLSLHERLIQTGKWQKRFNMVRSRPQFRIVSIRTIFSPFTSSRPQDQILAVTFRGGFVIEGTFNAIMSALHSRIVEAVEASFEEDAAAAALAGINA